MSGTLLARVQPIHRGVYDAAKAYETLDIVTNGEGTAAYMAVKDAPAGTALSDETYWEALVDIETIVVRANNATENANMAAERLNEGFVVTDDDAGNVSISPVASAS